MKVIVSYITVLLLISGVASGLEKLQNSTGLVINPATKESVDSVNNSVQSINSTLQSGIASSVSGTVAISSIPTTTIQGTVSVSSMPTVTANLGTIDGVASEPTLTAIAANQTNGSQVVKGNKTPSDTFSNPADAETVWSLMSIWRLATNRWVRLSGGSHADGITTSAALAADVRAQLYTYNGSTSDLLRGDTTNGAHVNVRNFPALSSYETTTSVPTVSGHKQIKTVHMDVQNASGTVGYMLIDLSDTSNWKHSLTGHITIEEVHVNVNPSTSFVGDIEFGFVSSVTTTSGTLNNVLPTVHLQQQATDSDHFYDYRNIGLNLKTTDLFGKTTTFDTTWQTDVNLYGPNGATSFPCGDGDMVMKLISTAGTIDIGITVMYTTGN